jgi:hypothetical protein
LADFDFGAIPSLNRARVLELARGHYTGLVLAQRLMTSSGQGEEAHQLAVNWFVGGVMGEQRSE